MNLIKAHIQNFGKLSDCDIDFAEGLNSFIHENGWGKTTLSVFIKAMFYGMEYTTSKDIEKNEKLKYLPWQGGIYGGTLSFSHNGRIYTIRRTFGLKKGEDTFELRDAKTNKPSLDFSENIGTELFGINRETYGRSVHIALDESPAGSADISAKLNNLVEAADVSSFEEAVNSLEKKSGALKAKRGSAGEIQQIQEAIDRDRDTISEIDAKIIQNENYQKKIEEINTGISNLKEKQDSLAKQLAVNAKYESKLRYEQLQNDVKMAQNTEKGLLDFFDGKLPENDLIEKIDEITRSYTTVKSNIKTNSITQAEKDQYESLRAYFCGDIPSKQQIESCLQTDSDYKKFKQEQNEKKLSDSETCELDSLKKRFDNTDISEQKINDNIRLVSDVQNTANEITRLESELQAKRLELKLSVQAKSTNLKRIVLWSAATACFIGVIAGFVLNLAMPLNLALFGIGTVAFVLGAVFKSKKQDLSALESETNGLAKKIEDLRSACLQKENSYKLFISKFCATGEAELIALNKISVDFSRYSTLVAKQNAYNAWLLSQPKTVQEYENELKMFVRRFCKSDDILSVPHQIQVLNEKLARLAELEKKVNSDSQNNQLQKEQKEKLLAILAQYKTDKALDFTQQVQEIHDRLNDIKNSKENLAFNIQKLKEFEENPENDVASFATLEKPEKPAYLLQNELSQVSRQIAEQQQTSADYQKIINDNLSVTEKKEDFESEIESLEIEKKEKIAEYDILQKTQKLLTAAKEKLDANYSDPMKEGFAKYVNMLGGKLNLAIDTDLKVLVDDGGKLHESAALSEGYKDMVNFCSRMALIDALFKDVKPPVILDDPFVNLDDDKVPRALKLVKDMAQEKQVLYFACHKSREV